MRRPEEYRALALVVYIAGASGHSRRLSHSDSSELRRPSGAPRSEATGPAVFSDGLVGPKPGLDFRTAKNANG